MKKLEWIKVDVIFLKLLKKLIIERRKKIINMEEIKKNENKLTFAELEQFVNADWGYGRSLLHKAVYRDNINLVKLCIQLNADVNKIDDHGLYGRWNIMIFTLLMSAVSHDLMSLIRSNLICRILDNLLELTPAILVIKTYENF